jgi:long-subunit fatty acid transport protein
MKKMSLTLLAAASMAVAGIAQADAIFYPDGTMVELGENGADTLALDGSIDTTVLGAAPSSMTVTTVQSPMVYVQPNINWDRTTAMTQMRTNSHLVHNGPVSQQQRTQAAATFNVPARAGEASTMTGGVPNATTDNAPLVVGSYTIPHTVVVGQPYYVFSY